MTTPNRPPLWRALKAADASWTSDLTIPEARAIKAMRDWLVPEEIEPTGMRPCGDTYSAQSIKRGERQRLRALLTTEADRAERATMADFSPAAQAIVAAFDARYELCGPFDDNWQELCLAAALRRLADHQTPAWDGGPLCHWTPTPCIRQELRNIATELEGHG